MNLATCRAIFLDLDGTVINRSGRIPPEVFQALDTVRDQGVALMTCTGRTRAGYALSVAHRFGPSHPHVFECGAMVAPATGPPVYTGPLPAESLEQLLAAAQKEQVCMELYSTSGIHVNRYDEPCRRHAEVLGLDVAVADLELVASQHEILRAHFILTREEVPRLSRTLDQISNVQVAHATSPALAGSFFISVTEARVSKATGVRYAAQKLGIPLEHCAGIGDSASDADYLSIVGFPFAMASGDTALHQAFEVIPSVEDAGVLEALRRLELFSDKNS